MHWDRRMKRVCAQLGLLAYFVLTVDSAVGLGQNQVTEFTFLLPAGSTECFFQSTARNDSLEVQYRVTAGSGLDVGFVLISPSGQQLGLDFRGSDGVHGVDHTEVGDYRLCFDNSFSKLSAKMVFFEVIVISQSDAGGVEWAKVAAAENLVEYQLEDIRASMDSVYRHLERSRQVQRMLRSSEARDRSLLEDNLWRVSFWSCLNLLVMLTVAASQIYTLRSLFHNTRRVCT